MALTVQIRYQGKGDAARCFAEEMTSSGTVEKIRAEEGNLRYEYYFPMEEDGSVLLVDTWADQKALDAHHASPLMGEIAALRDKYDLKMIAEKYLSVSDSSDAKYIRK